MNILLIFSGILMKEVILKFFGSSDSFWNDLKSNVLIKILSVFDIFSFGYYYVNVIFYSFVTMFGPICCFRVMNDVFPGRKITLALLLPSSFHPSFTGPAVFIKMAWYLLVSPSLSTIFILVSKQKNLISRKLH